MKRFIIILFSLLISCISYSQNIEKNKDYKNEDVKITINITKISQGLGKVVNAISNEAKEFKKDIDENLPEFYDAKESLIKETKKGLKQCHDEFHRGFRQGLRGEKYDPNKD